ncbi:MAG: aminotransferase class I/II-fold pyridoxal phosphate-dependent enzyme, partial [Coriobacteriaceae bacterium]|nr:aminotransferase class I/II-fold pyridoxal phosphate-dependent enzyme [Coriobacteriaceae bacterium]
NMPPTFSVYEHNARITDTRVVSIPRKADFSINEEAVCDRVAFGDIDFIVVTSPNNPTGNTADPSFIKRLLESSDAMVLVDEAYFEFAGATVLPWLNRYKNLAILRTLSKAYGLAGVRLGYLLAHADVISELLKVRQPYSVDTVSQLIGTCVLEQRAAFDRHIAATIDQRDLVFEALGKMGGVRPYPSDANFILFRLENASKVWESLYSRGVLVRDFSRERGLKNCLRVTIGTPDENRCFLDVLEDILAQEGDSHGK